eukprot:m.92504 g.92504  ORF g.92504 m.92504 type:complete len:139 (-) comp14948_c0_seq1:1624-2040(-)
MGYTYSTVSTNLGYWLSFRSHRGYPSGELATLCTKPWKSGMRLNLQVLASLSANVTCNLLEPSCSKMSNSVNMNPAWINMTVLTKNVWEEANVVDGAGMPLDDGVLSILTTPLESQQPWLSVDTVCGIMKHMERQTHG